MIIMLPDDSMIPLLEFSMIVLLPNEIVLITTAKYDVKTGLVLCSTRDPVYRELSVPPKIATDSVVLKDKDNASVGTVNNIACIKLYFCYVGYADGLPSPRTPV